MKRWFVNEDNLYGKLQTGNQLEVVLASDVKRLRAEAREKLARFIASETHNDDNAPCTFCYTRTDEYLNVIFGEDQT